MQGGLSTAGVVILVYIVIRQVEDQLVMPVVIGRAVHLHPIVTIFAVLIGLEVYGVLGGLLGVPAAAAINVIFTTLYPRGVQVVEDTIEEGADAPAGGPSPPPEPASVPEPAAEATPGAPTDVGPASARPVAPVRSRGETARLIFILGALSAFGPLSIDMYLPALPAIGTDLAASASEVQLTLTACFIGLALGQIVAGPLSDAFGRRRPLLVGLAAFAVASLLCAAAPNIATLVVLRVVQGAGGAAGIVISRAVVRDLFEGIELARFYALTLLVNGAAPIVAPIVGGLVLLVTSWHGDVRRPRRDRRVAVPGRGVRVGGVAPEPRPSDRRDRRDRPRLRGPGPGPGVRRDTRSPGAWRSPRCSRTSPAPRSWSRRSTASRPRSSASSSGRMPSGSCSPGS